MTLPGQHSLKSFYISVKLRDPRLGELMRENIVDVALGALSADRTAGQASADALRRQSENLPEVFRRVLETALTDLGYS